MSDVIIEDMEEERDESDTNGTDSDDPDEFFARNAFRIIYQTNNFFLPQIHDLIKDGQVLNLRPEYQRRLRWKGPQKSRLIESLLLNIPIPPVFLYESDAARYEVMDGQQRLNAVREYIAGDFALSGLSVLRPLNGLRYYRCPPRIKRALDRSSLSAIVLLLESSAENSGAGHLKLTDIRRFVFDRLNTGGTRLNAQEIRNALYPGKFNDAIISITRNDLFTRIFDIPPYTEANPNEYYENVDRQKNNLYSTMGDCQLVLRYFALRDEQNIRGSMKAMLDRAMEQRQKISENEAEDLKAEYIRALEFFDGIFDGMPFRLHREEGKRQRISAALYDASMVAVHRVWQRDVTMADKATIQSRVNDILGNAEDVEVITGRGNTAQAVRDRITLLERTLAI